MLIAPQLGVHIGELQTTHDLWQAWPAATMETVVLGGSLLAGAIIYVRGVAALWAHAAGVRGISRARVASFVAGVLVIAFASLTPLDVLAAELFTAHMVQHLLIIMVAAPLLLLGEPAMIMLWAWPLAARRNLGAWWKRATLRRLASFLSRPLVAVPLHTAVVWLWHAPRLYDAALRSPALHALEHATFLITALLFWHGIVDRRALRRSGAPVAIASLFVIALQCVVLGALIAMARHPWYNAHLATSAKWGLLPLADQQLAGILMWVPAGVVYLGAMVAIAVPVLSGRDARRRGASREASREARVTSTLPQRRTRAYATK